MYQKVKILPIKGPSEILRASQVHNNFFHNISMGSYNEVQILLTFDIFHNPHLINFLHYVVSKTHQNKMCASRRRSSLEFNALLFPAVNLISSCTNAALADVGRDELTTQLNDVFTVATSDGNRMCA